jgi:PTS system nitrogen regulatory IIA component
MRARGGRIAFCTIVMRTLRRWPHRTAIGGSMPSPSVSTCPHVAALDVDAYRAEGLLREAARLAAGFCDSDPAVIYRALARREQAASTALGAGVAIPHARIDGIDQRVTLLIRTRWAIDFRAPDHKPVTLFYVILVPRDGDPQDHLDFLARVSAALGDVGIRRRLAMAGSPDAAKLAFVTWEDSVAADASPR